MKPSQCAAASGGLAVVLAIALAGCTTVEQQITKGAPPVRRPVRTVNPADVQPDEVRFEGTAAFVWVDGASGKTIGFDDVILRANNAQVIVVGEQHDEPSHHEIQRRVIAALGRDKELVVGLEMLPWDKQPALDLYNGGALDLDALAAKVEWQKTWGFTFELYRLVLAEGRARGARFVALNAPRELVRAIRKKGVGGLSPDEVRVLPDLDLGDATHRAWFESIFADGHHPMKDADVDSFYTAQVVWDETMADRAARALDGGAARVVVLAGAGHVARGRGIPQRVERRVPSARVLSIVPLTGVDTENVAAQVKRAVVLGEGDILVIPRFEEELAL